MFIAFEGGEGAGKTSQIRLLDRHLSERGEQVLGTREPGGTSLGQQLRQLLLHTGTHDPRAEALMFAADRADHVGTVIQPALAAGVTVITDRYLDSSLAYQGAQHTDPATLAMVEAISLWAARGLVPDLTIVLDVPPEIGLTRAKSRSAADTMESRDLSYHHAVREGFLQLADRAPQRYLVIDATKRPADIHRDICVAIEARFPGHQGGVDA